MAIVDPFDNKGIIDPFESGAMAPTDTAKSVNAPKKKTLWEKAKGAALDVVTEPFKIAGEAVSAPVMAAKKGYVGLTKVLPATLGTLASGRGLDESLAAGVEARKEWEDQGGGKLPFQSKTGQFIANKLIQPGANALGRVTGQPEIVNSLIEAGGDIAALMGIKPTAKAAIGVGKNMLRKLPDSGIPYTNPEKLYSSAAKLPLSKAWTKQLGEKGMTKRKAAIRAGIEGEVPISEVGIQKAKGLEKAYRATVDEVVKQLDSTGTLIPKEKLRAGLSTAAEVAETEGTAYAQGLVDRLYDKRFEKMGRMVKTGERQIPAEYKTGAMGEKVMVAPARVEPIMERQYMPSEIQAIKRHLYKMENYEKQKLSRGLGSQLKELGNKGMAHEAKVALEEMHPELKALNAKDAAYISLIEALERAVPRIQNKDVVGLGAKVLLTGSHPWTAVLEHVTGLPAVKSRLAFALNKARRIKKTPIRGNAAKSAAAGLAKSATTQPLQEVTDETP